MAIASIFKKAYLALVAGGALYFIFLGLLSQPWIQRHALYAHKLHSAWWQDPNTPEQFGFASNTSSAENQVSRFNLSTPDGKTLYAWHILPLGLYAKHQAALSRQPEEHPQYSGSLPFKLLRENAQSRLVINFHGNAGHVGQGWRTDTYRAISSGSTEHIHVLTFDYRGFGRSSGSNPTEEGLITDGIAAVTWALEVAGIPLERIVLLGQSLGTAVATAVAEHFAASKIEFLGVVLVAGFTDIPSLLLTYSIAGIIPILSPLRPYPVLQKWFSRRIYDTWETATRLRHFVRISHRVRLYLIHATNDFDIPWRHSDSLFYAAVNGTSDEGISAQEVDALKVNHQLGAAGWTNTWDAGGQKIIRQEIMRYGG
ncbi:MAG: hypothetical protein M1835_007337 [Candelina submexicana]|nr:MAG: hypothetical protein M1835_007337 [Candelina submexicana]